MPPNPPRLVLHLVSSLAFTLTLALTAFAQTPTRKALLIGIDGMRADCLTAANTPNLDTLIANGSIGPTCQSEDISLSGPCWSTILTGVHRAKHLVVDNSFSPNAFATYPHFFARVRTACPDVRTASIVHWAPVNDAILQGHADTILTNLTDDGVRDACIAALSADTADLIYLHFDDVDHAGHTFGFSPAVPQYIAAIEQEDARVGQIVAALQARPTYANEDWLVVVVSDHGGSGTSHGQNTPEQRTTQLIVSGPSSAVGTTMPTQPTLADVAPTVMTFLGLAIDPAWGWDGSAVGLDLAGSSSVPVHCSPRVVLLSEDFESVPLGPSVDEAPATQVWSGAPPAGWTVDDSGVPGVNDPNLGVTEWEGWAVARKDWWVSTAADQNRSQFTRGSGAVAVADSDEHDDRGAPAPSTLGPYDAHLATPSISLAGIAADTVAITFDSSWRFEGVQRALLTVRFDGGAPVTLLDWSSAAGPNFKPDATNENVRVHVPNPAGAAVMSFDFALLDGRNNWWWAIDDVVVDGVLQSSATAFCLGDGTGAPCPCGNSGTAGRGCANSSFAAGALLTGAGNASVASDTLVLSSASLTGSTCVYFQGSLQQSPVVVDDGLGCVTGSVIRLGTKSIALNASSFPQPGDPLISVRGALPGAGGTRYYQCFYRNAASAFCPPATSNRTNGVAVPWAP